MSALSSLGRKAREIFDREVRHRAHTCSRAQSLCPASWLLDEMVRLLDELPSQPTRSDLRSAVRRRIELYSFHDECGDASAVSELSECGADKELEAYVGLLTDVLEQVRREASRKGELSTGQQAATPMFG